MNSHLKELEERISYEFKNKNLFTQALTHSSYANEHRLDPVSYTHLPSVWPALVTTRY